MKSKIKTIFIIVILHSCFSVYVFSQIKDNKGKDYSDGRGGKIHLPLGDLSFADEAVSFNKGNPAAKLSAQDSTLALGSPNFDNTDGGFTTLGCGGSLVLRFIDNALVNIPGPDLYVFEVGKFIEKTNIAISKDGNKWVNVGNIAGGTASIDIGDSVKSGEIFHYVKLTDLKSDCRPSWPGADIDAVAAIGSAEQLTLKSALLFDFNEYALKPNSKVELDKIINKIKANPTVEVVIEGHTDNIGKKDYNQKLSENRANSVKKQFDAQLKGMNIAVKTFGYADRNPIASNNTKEGQDKNRRVEIILIPASAKIIPKKK
jgi:outer membrane protein OmpA-like peptidoglycan-associated protein